MEKVEQNGDKVVGSLSLPQGCVLLPVGLSRFAVVDARYSMPGKVLHISDELHARIRAYCTEKGVRISDWAEEAVSRAFDLYLQEKREPVVVVREEVTVSAVEKREIQPLIKENPHGDPRPWELAPFWERRGYPTKKVEERQEQQLEAGGNGFGCGGGSPVEEGERAWWQRD